MAGAAEAGSHAAAAAFVFMPNRYLHPSWRDEILAEPVWRLLADCPRVEGRFAAFVTKQAGLASMSPDSIDPPKARFCLMPGEALMTVARRVGLALNAQRISRLIDARTVSRLRRELGVEAHEFALRHAPLITTQTDPLTVELESETPLAPQFERSGINYMGLALSDLDQGLRERLKLKLPREHAALLLAPRGDNAPREAWQVVRKVVREAEPEWSALLE